MIGKYGYETMPQERTYNTYESIYCWNNASVHDYIKFLKFGYGKVSDHASRDIRLKRISRAEGIERVRQYQNVVPKSLGLFLEWLGMSEEAFYACIDPFRDPAAWQRDNDGNWNLLHSVCDDSPDDRAQTAELSVEDPRDYQLTPLLESVESDQEYILLGRGYMDEENNRAVEG